MEKRQGVEKRDDCSFYLYLFLMSSVEKRDDCWFYLFLFLLSSVEKRDDCSFYLFLFLALNGGNLLHEPALY